MKTILVIDDETNIRMTVSYALEVEGFQVDTAVNGEDALQQMIDKQYNLLLLDLQMPGMGGMEFLRRLVARNTLPHVVIISAHGTVTNAVEAMKLGAVDFIQKPFTPEELRRLVAAVFARDVLDPTAALTYEENLQLVKRLVGERRMEEAIGRAKETIGLDPQRPEAFNLLGALYDIEGERAQAMKNYRVALDLDPTYQIAQKNLQRRWEERSQPDLG